MIDLQNLDEAKWEELKFLMNDENRESVHAELAPCSREEFLKRYIDIHPEFLNTVKAVLS